MKRHFDDELKKLKDELFKMGLLVEEAIAKATEALLKRDEKLARTVIEEDQRINILEIKIDEFGHELIALMQPTAIDLRLITMVLKLNSDLERMGDQAVNIAECAIALSREAPVEFRKNIPRMTALAIQTVKDSLNAFVERDAVKAKLICEHDDELDQLKDTTFAELKGLMQTKPEYVSQAVSLIMVAHNLERIGDLATNIAEDTIYVAKGIDIRHHITERRED